MAQASRDVNLPSKTESLLAKETSRMLSARLHSRRPLALRFADSAKHQTMKIPAPAAKMLLRILEEMGDGNAVTVVPVRPELTTQEAADLLNISRPSLIQLLETGKVAFRKVGTHRRVQLDSLLQCKRQADAARKAALAELVTYDQEIGL
jgi:excisionase family DNA binding protein